MSFLDGIQQYQNSTTAASQGTSHAKDAGAVRQVSQQTQGLAPGKVFEGTVTEIKNGQVTIGLNDGSSISARMDAGVSLEKGQPMLFEVKSNNGEQIAIRPVMPESAQNPTLLKALEAAGIKVTDRSLSMVNQMMAEKLPINKESLQQMMRTLAGFPKADIQTLVQMQKSGFVITEDSLNQFQNYKNGQQAILPEMNRLMDGIANLPGQIFGTSGSGMAAQTPEAMLALQRQILEIILGDGNQASEGVVRPNGPEGGNPLPVSPGMAEGGAGIPGGIAGEAGMPGETAASGTAQPGQAAESGQPGNLPGRIVQAAQSGQAAGETQAPGMAGGEAKAPGGIAGEAGEVGKLGEAGIPGGIAGELSPGETRMPGETAASGAVQASASGQAAESGASVSVAQILSAEQQGELTSILQELSGAGKEQLLAEGKLNTDMGAGEFLKQMMEAFHENGLTDAASMQKLFRSDAYKNLLRQAMTDQWMLTPEKLKEEGAVKDLYQRLSNQLGELQQTLAQAGKEGAVLAKSAQSVQSSLEFMNQINQLYTYVQLPLKLQNQNVHSDLYVYTNKKNLRQKEGELTALLHLDMDNLGSTDIFVKLLGTSVQTEFYFEDEFSCRLISGYSNDLIKRLEEKGYSCDVKVENRRKKQDFVQDFLERENPPGKLQRYSFDVKA